MCSALGHDIFSWIWRYTNLAVYKFKNYCYYCCCCYCCTRLYSKDEFKCYSMTSKLISLAQLKRRSALHLACHPCLSFILDFVYNPQVSSSGQPFSCCRYHLLWRWSWWSSISAASTAAVSPLGSGSSFSSVWHGWYAWGKLSTRRTPARWENGIQI